LNEQIKQLTTQKIQLEAKEKRLSDEVGDLKKKYDEENERTSELERSRNGLDDTLKDLNYRLNQMQKKDRTGVEQKKNFNREKIKRYWKGFKEITTR